MFLASENAAGLPLLTLTVLLPLAGAGVVTLLRRRSATVASRVASGIGGLTFLLATVLAATYDRQWFGARPAFQFADPPQGPLAGLPGGIAPQLAVDGVGLGLLWLTALLALAALIEVRRQPATDGPAQAVRILLLEAGLVCAFSALDLSLFLLGWLVALIAGFGLVRGGGEFHCRREWSRLAISCLLGPGLVAAAALACASVAAGPADHLLEQLRRPMLASRLQALWLGAFLLSLLSPLVLLPGRVWLPRLPAAPPLGMLAMAVVLLRLQTYGLARFGMPLAPLAALGAVPSVVSLGVVGLGYATWLAVRQRDLGGRLGWLAVGQTALVVAALGALNPQSLSGGILQLFCHSLAMAVALLLLRGAGELPATSSRRPARADAPIIRSGALLRVSLLAAAGFPLTACFVAEWLSLLGVFRAQMMVGALATFLAALALVCLLWPRDRLFLGQDAATMEARNLTPRELLTLVPLMAIILGLGLRPAIALTPVASSCQAWLALLPAVAAAGP